MGTQASKEKEMASLVKSTHFTREDIISLYNRFQSISSIVDDDGVIDFEEFRSSLGLSDTLLSRRMFAVFDENSDGVINFPEFCRGLSCLSPKGTTKEKAAFAFRVYDLDGDCGIDKEELYQILSASLEEKFVHELSEEKMREMVDGTFDEVDTNGDGRISLEEFCVMCEKYPAILSRLVLYQIPGVILD